jgi:hypothetical protein
MFTESNAILDIADMLRRDGHRLYNSGGMEGCMYQASLCGVTASFGRGGAIMQIVAHDLQVGVTLTEAPVDDDGIDHNSATRLDVSASYAKGDADVLNVWHKHLCVYRRSMRAGHSAAA